MKKEKLPLDKKGKSDYNYGEGKKMIGKYRNYPFGDIFKKIRIENNLSQSALAKICGIHHSLISLIEDGKRKPNYLIIYKLKKSGLLKDIDKLFERGEKNVKRKKTREFRTGTGQTERD